MSSLQFPNVSAIPASSSSYQENISSTNPKHSQKQDQQKGEHLINLSKIFKESIEKKNISIAKQILEQESVFKKKTLLILLSMVLQTYSPEMIDIVKLLIRKGADVDDDYRPSNQTSKVDGMTIIMFICQKGDTELLDVVLEYSNNINKLDNHGKNALIYAILSGKGDDAISIIVKKLINKGTNVDVEFNFDRGRKVITTHSPLSLATELNLTQTALVLLDNTAKPNFKTIPDKQTVLHIAVKNSNLDIVNALLQREDVLLEEKNEKGQTPGQIAAALPKTEIYKNIAAKIEDNKKNNITNNVDGVNSNNHYDNNTSTSSTTITSGCGNYNNNNNNTETHTVNHSSKNDESLVAQKNTHFPLQQHMNVQKKITSLSKQYKDIKLKHQNKKSTSTFKIPFNFIKSNKQQQQPQSSSLYLSSYINFTNTKEPELIIDLSSDQLDLEQKHTQTLTEKNNTITTLESEIASLKQELETYRSLNLKHRQKEEEDQLKIVNLNEQLKYLTKQNEDLQKTISHLEKENKDLHFKLSQDTQPLMNNPTTMSQYLNKKYIHFTYDPTYLFNCLSKDIIEYQRYVFERLQNEQHHYTMLIQNLQNTVNECLKEYDVHLYGSHATGLCLPWSDLDVVLIPRTPKLGQNVSLNNQKLLKQLFEFIRQQPWVKDAKFIASASMPIIKLISVPQYNSIPIDISIQDERHFGLQCVDLVKNFISQYESLKPLVLALKNILKQANLNDPYKGGISSYGLILMIVSFLQTQKRSGLDISVSQNNLGKLFFDCVNYYGLQFDPAKFIIYARKTEDDENDEINLQVSIYIYINYV